jgi:alcohol dehydrogenase class IV
VTTLPDVLELRKFVAPEFVFGNGARLLVGRYAANLGASRVLVVTDSGVIAAGWVKQITDNLENEGISCAVFSEISPNPRDNEVMAGAAAYEREGCDAIVAIGGGSPMDCAKGIGIVSSNKRHILTFKGVDQVPVPSPPLICIPTTSGTSADVSQFAIIVDTQNKVKIAIVSKAVVPDVALIDPATTVSMNAYLTACTGLDALVHAMEAYVSNAHSPIADLHALEAVRLVAANLIGAIQHPDDLETRALVMLGSLYAGLAFSNASLGAVHAMAHSLGGLLDFAHGEANAILLSHVIEFNYEASSERYLQIGKAMRLQKPDKGSFMAAITQLVKAAGIHRSLGAMGLQSGDIPELARKAMLDACVVTNPRRPTQQDIEAIYERAC